MKKYIRVTMPDGSQWDVLASIIAESRAGSLIGDGLWGSPEFNAEVDFALGDPSVLFDWAGNNMNWDDIRDVAQMVSTGECDYQEGWVNGRKEVVEK